MTDTYAAIRVRRAEIARVIELLRAEDDELATAELVLQRLGGADGPVRADGSGAPARRAAQRPRSQREYVLDILGTSEAAWLRTAEIIKQAKARWGVSIPEPSLRPLLSVMKKQRLIVRHGRFVALRERSVEPPQGARRQEM